MSDTFHSLQSLLERMTPEIHQLLKTAVHLGHWRNGEKLTDRQKALCLRAINAYDQVLEELEDAVTLGTPHRKQSFSTGRKNSRDE